jgi:peptidoglycan/xylan/chitin deacetylase (PgdA/CDA1 family)
MWAGLGVAAAVTGLAAYAVRGRSSQLLGPSLWRGPRHRAEIALTFDDGPSPSTARLLEILARHGARATFFQCGLNVERHPGIACAVSAAGHQIGNHGYSHTRLWFRSPQFIYGELERAQRSISAVTGTVPTLFRAPYGVRWFGLARAQRRLNLLGVMWTVLGRDWKLPADRILARLAAGARNGAILCLHDGRELEMRPEIGETLRAVERLLPLLRDRGFRLVTVGDLLRP